MRLVDLPPVDQAHLLGKDCAPLPGEPFVLGPPLAQRRVAIVTTAGVHPSVQPNFDLRDTGYRVIPGDIDGRDLAMSHSSVNFDRSGFQQDINVVFPLDRLRELADAGEIGSVAAFHYALNGAGWEPHEIEPTAAELATMLAADKVDAAVLAPV